jgi:GT2 family glycosyltransferase
MGGALVITVLMSVWNSPLDELEQAIRSILTQTFADFEFLIVDDGSTDPRIAEYLGRSAARDTRIRLVQEGHRGLTASLNRGIELARGQVIARQDADDWSDPRRLERQTQFFAATPDAILCGTDAWTHQQNGFRLWRTRLPQTPERIAEALPKGNPFVHGSTMYLRKAALEAGGYCEQFRCSQDYDFFWRLSESGAAYNLGEPLYHYRYSAGSISVGKAGEQRIAHRAAKRLASARLTESPEEVSSALSAARKEIEREGAGHQALLKQADHLMLAGQYRAAARAYARLLWEHPGSPLAWAKLLRLGVFVTLPAAREACFR